MFAINHVFFVLIEIPTFYSYFERNDILKLRKEKER